MGSRGPTASNTLWPFRLTFWNARGRKPPKTFPDIQVREKEIRFSSKTRAGTEHYKYSHKLRVALANIRQSFLRNCVIILMRAC